MLEVIKGHMSTLQKVFLNHTLVSHKHWTWIWLQTGKTRQSKAPVFIMQPVTALLHTEPTNTKVVVLGWSSSSTSNHQQITPGSCHALTATYHQRVIRMLWL